MKWKHTIHKYNVHKNEIPIYLGFFILLIFITIIRIAPFGKTLAIAFGESMQPTFGSGDLLIVNKKKPITQDAVVIAMVSNKINNRKKQVCKRVIGMPGDFITVKDQELMVNGTSKGKISNQNIDPNYQKLLGKKEYFLLGDNRSNSIDSCTYGPISSDAILGVVENVKEKTTS